MCRLLTCGDQSGRTSAPIIPHGGSSISLPNNAGGFWALTDVTDADARVAARELHAGPGRARRNCSNYPRLFGRFLCWLCAEEGKALRVCARSHTRAQRTAAWRPARDHPGSRLRMGAGVNSRRFNLHLIGPHDCPRNSGGSGIFWLRKIF